MYLDVEKMMYLWVRVCWFEMPVCLGIDKIQIRAILNSDFAVFTGDGEIC